MRRRTVRVACDHGRVGKSRSCNYSCRGKVKLELEDNLDGR